MYISICNNNILKIDAISNEGRELTIYHVSHFGFKELIQLFLCSCFAHFSKPEKDIYRVALDLEKVAPEQSIYIDERILHVEVVRSLRTNAIHYIDIETTKDS